MRGDPPLATETKLEAVRSTPHARGSTHFYYTHSSSSPVYPACAGIHLYDLYITGVFFSLPRMRGDPPALSMLFWNSR